MIKLFKEYKHQLLINSIILGCLFLLNCFFGFATYLAYLFLLVVVIFSSLNHGLCYLLFSLPFSFINLYENITLLLVCALAYVVKLFYFFFFKEKQKLSKPVLILFACLVGYLLLPIGPYNLNLFIKICLVSFIVLVFAILFKKTEWFNIVTICYEFCAAIFVSSVFSLTRYISPFLQENLTIIPLTENIDRFQALMNHPNFLAILCLITLSVLLYMIARKKGIKIVNYSLCVGVTLIGLFTFSRTFLFVLLFLFVWIFVWGIKHKSKFITIVLSCGVVFAIIAAIFNFGVVKTILDRFNFFDGNQTFLETINNITNGRSDLWLEYISYMFKNPLVLFFGAGLGAPTLSGLSAHNTFISMIYQMGLVGAGLFVALLVLIVKQLKVKFNKHALIIILSLVLLFMVEDTIFYILLF